MIGRLFWRFHVAGVWARANQLSASGRHDEALALIQSVEPPPRMLTAWRLFEVHQLSLLRRHKETLNAAISLVDELLARANLTPDSRYFLCFAQWCGSVAFSRLFPGMEKPAKLNLEMASLALSDVSSGWKRKFPLSIHPEWKP